MASTRGMHYMSNTPEEIVRGSLLGGGVDDLIGASIEDQIKAEVAKEAARQLVSSAREALLSGDLDTAAACLGFGLNFNPLHALKSALRLSARPFTYQANLANRLIHGAAHMRLPGEGGGGRGGGGAPASAAPDAAAPDPGAAPDGGGDDGSQAAADDGSTQGRLMGMLQSPDLNQRVAAIEGAFPGAIARFIARRGHHHRGRRGPHHKWQAPQGWRAQNAAAMGFSLRNLFHRAKPAGKLIVSATPGGTTALQAHALATKALKSGALKPDHLKKAAALTKAGRKGDDKALVKIANIKAQANKGNPHAAVALDRLKLANCLQTGAACKGSGGQLSQSYSDGLRILASRRGRTHF